MATNSRLVPDLIYESRVKKTPKLQEAKRIKTEKYPVRKSVIKLRQNKEIDFSSKQIALEIQQPREDRKASNRFRVRTRTSIPLLWTQKLKLNEISAQQHTL